MAHMRIHVQAGLHSFLLIAVMLSAAPDATWAENPPSTPPRPPTPAGQCELRDPDSIPILNLLRDIRERSKPKAEHATVQYPPPDPSREDLQQLVKALKKIDPYLQKTLVCNFKYFDDKAVALDVLRYLQPPREIALPYYEREIKTLSPHDYYLMETVVRSMLQFGGLSPESRIPLMDRLETRSEFIRERAFQEFRALPTPKQETVITALRTRWAELSYKQGEARVWPVDTLLRLASQREAERLVEILQPDTILISCSRCEDEKQPLFDHMVLVQSAQVTMESHTYSSEVAKGLGIYTVLVTGFELLDLFARPDPSRKHLLDHTAYCASRPRAADEDPAGYAERHKPGSSPAPSQWMIRPSSEIMTLYMLPGIRSANAPKWIGAPWTVGKPTVPAVLPFSERDRKKLTACVQLQQEVLATSQSVLDSIKEAGGTIVSDINEYGIPAKLAPNSDQFFGAAGPTENSTEMHIQSNTVTPQGLKTLEGFCRNKGPSFFVTSYNGTGQANCHRLVKGEEGYSYHLSLTLSGSITETARHWSDMLLSRTPLPPQTWRARPPTLEEQRFADEQGNRHIGALGRLDPRTYSFTVIEAKDGRKVIILPLHMDPGVDGSSTTYLVLANMQGEWKTLYGVEEESLNDFWVDLDGDGFPEMWGSPGYQSAAIWKVLPSFTRLFQRLGG